jgi:hypothetical protein
MRLIHDTTVQFTLIAKLNYFLFKNGLFQFLGNVLKIGPTFAFYFWEIDSCKVLLFNLGNVFDEVFCIEKYVHVGVILTRSKKLGGGNYQYLILGNEGQKCSNLGGVLSLSLIDWFIKLYKAIRTWFLADVDNASFEFFRRELFNFATDFFDILLVVFDVELFFQHLFIK